MTIEERSGHWSAPQQHPVFEPAASAGELRGVSCPTSETCLAVGEVIDQPQGQQRAFTEPEVPVAYSLVDGKWSWPTTLAMPRWGVAPTRGGYLAGVDCTRQQWCEAIGAEEPPNSDQYLRALTYVQRLAVSGPATAPNAPALLLVAPDAHGLIVRWQAPIGSGGEPIAGYHVTISGGAGPTRHCVTMASHCLVGGIAIDHLYTVSVRAVNIAGIVGPARTVRITIR
jgi:hypothetical protein